MLLRWGGAAVGILTLLLYARSLWGKAFRNNPEFAVGRFEYHSNGGIPARQAAMAALASITKWPGETSR